LDNLDSFYNELSSDIKKQNDTSPDWVSNENHSLKAYEAINILKKQKEMFISKNKLKSAYKKRGNFIISKTEVGNKVGKNSQTLFSKYEFSSKLKTYFNDINSELEKKANKRIHAAKGSLQSRSKKELIQETKKSRSEIADSRAKSTAELLQLTLDKLPLDVKRALKLT